MTKLLHQKIFRILLIIFIAIAPQLQGQVTMSTTGNYTQNFDSFPNLTSGNSTWTQNSTLANWYSNRTTLTNGSGSGNAGAFYNFGNSTDRALGSLCSGTVDPVAYGILLKNTSGSTITNITVSYTMEQWRNGGNTTAQPLKFYYKTSTSALSESDVAGTTDWTQVAGLSVNSPITGSTAAQLVGNSAANRTTVTDISLTGLSLANDSFIMLKWHDVNDTGNDHGLSIDDLTINWEVPVANVAPTITGNSIQSFTYGTAGSYDFTATGTPAPTFTATLDPSGSLPVGMTLDSASKQIDVAATVAAATYNIIISATNSEGTVTKNVELIVNKANQIITFANITKVYGDPDFSLTATGGASGESITYISSDTNVATISGNTVTIVGAGTTNITASQAGNTNYNAAADEIRTLTVGKADQTINNFNDITKIFGDPDFNLTATGGASGEPITYTSSDTNVATITGNTVTIVSAGTSTITASQAGNINYNAGSLAHTLTINKASQTITFANVTKTYGDADFNLTATGGNSGEPITYTSSDTSVATVSGNTVTITGAGTTNITASQAGNTNYDVAADVIRTLTVDPKAITITGAIADNKTYDGNTTATVSGSILTPSEVVGSDDVSLGTYTAVFNNASVAINKPVTITYQLTGAQANRYTLTQPTGLTSEIIAKQLTVTGIQIDDKYYDGNTSATISGTPLLNGIVNSEDVTLDNSAATAVFSDPNVNNSIPVVVSGYSLTGAAIANYTLQQPQGLTANILDVTLQNQTITFNPLANVTYGDADFVFTATATSGLNVTYSSSDTSVATVTGNTVTILNVGTTTITANQAGDSSYNPAPAVQQQLTVTPKTLTVTNATIADKIYDQTTVAVASGTLSGVINSDDATLVSAATFTTDDVGNTIAITSQYSITGNDIAKYILIQPVITGNIIPATLTLTSPEANDKAYDTTTNAVITGTLNGILNGDIVTLNGTGVFASENVGTGILVTSTSTLSGTDANNYILSQPTGLSADITGISVTVTATGADKVYDRTTDATLTVTQTNGVLIGDDVTVTGNGAFDNYNVGINKPITTNLTLTGADAANYTLTQPTGLTAAITAKTLTVDTANTNVTPKAYDGSTIATLANTAFIGVVAGDEMAVTATTGSFAQNTPGTGIAVNNIVLTGSASANYTLTQPTTLTGTIVQKQLTIMGAVALNKVYDNTTDAIITGALTGIVTGDNVTLIGAGTFASADVSATGILVTSTSSLTGADASNYTLQQPGGLSAMITAKTLNVNATAQDKVYDRTTSATVSNGQLVASDIIVGDDVSLVSTSVAGTFNNFNVGNAKPVTATFALQGADATNYTAITQATTANITPLAITADISSASVTTKQYSNTNTAVLTGVILNGILAGDTVNAITGTFATITPGENIAVTIALTGSSATNYTLTQPSPAITGIITKKTLIVTADTKTKTVGAANPALTLTASGFASGESATNALGYMAPSISTTADAVSPAGAYPIILTGGSADYYEISLVNGWLIVNPPVNTVFTTGTLWSNPITDSAPNAYNPFIIGQDIPADTYINVSGVGRGSGIAGNAASNRYNANGWNSTFDSNDYFYFTITPATGYKINFTGFTYVAQASGSGPTTSVVRSSADNYTANIGTASVSGATISLTETAYQNITTAVTFRVYAYGGSSASGTFSINDFSFSGSVVEVPVTTAPQITSSLTANSIIGDGDAYQITVSGTPAIALNTTNLPTGVTADNTGLLTFDGTTPAGVYNISLSASGYYGTDTETLVYTVLKQNQFLTFTPDPIPNKFLNDAPFVISVTNSAPLALTFTSSDPSVATIAQDGTITIVGAGTTTISASNTGDLTYNAVNMDKTLTVLPTPEITAMPSSISFTAIQGQGPSVAVQLNSISGINLVPASGNITLTASSGFELAMGIGAYGTSADFAYSGGTFSQTMPQIFVRFAAGQAVGTYNGTLTITGGSSSIQIPLTATVELAPAVITTTTAFGPYCFGNAYSIDIPYTTQGTFGAGNYYAQISDVAGVFPNDFSNIISAAANISPINAQLAATLAAGNYKVRIVHLSSGLVLTASINDNGSDIVLNTTPAPTASAPTFCNNATVANLTATGTDLKWYTAANGGMQLTLTDVVTTGNYFVSQTLNNCESIRTQVAVTVNVTSAPTASALTFCNNATVANLTATGTNLKWYAAANGGTQLALTDAVATGNYFVSQTLNNCESARTQVAVTVNVTSAPTASALTFCNNATVANLTATGTDLKWYAAANGGMQLAPTDAIATGNYFVSQTLNNCESIRTQVAVTVNVTTVPTASALTFCNNATVANLTATGTNLKWYAAANGGMQLAPTDAIATGNYFVSQTLNNCESTRTQVAVTVNNTSAPTASALTFLNAATVADLTAIGTDLKWYAAVNGGTQLANSTSVATGTYFVSQTLNGCESTRTEVQVTVTTTNPVPPAPTAIDHEFCNSAIVNNLTADGVDLKWYTTAIGGTALATTTQLSTGNYYVTQTVNGVESDRTEIEVIINVTPPPTASPITFCQLGFAANLVATGTDLKWYDVAIGGTQLTPNTPLSSGNYYVSQTLNECESTRTEVQVIINITPAPQAEDIQLCSGSTVADLIATGTDLKWYSYPSSGSVHLPETLLTSGNYYVSQTLNGCESSRTLVAVTLTTTALPIAANQTFCNGATIADLSVTVTGSNLKFYQTLTGDDLLNEAMVMTTGNYYVSQSASGCESQRKNIYVIIHTTLAPTGNTEQIFTEEGLTIADLESEGEDIKWYASETDAIAGVNQLPETTILVSETAYYATQTIDGCESNETLAVTVTIVLGLDEVQKFTFSYFPNPVVDKLQINSDETITNVKVYSLAGQLVIDEKWNTPSGMVTMSSLESGVYIVKINFGDIEKTIRVIRDK